MYFDGCGSWVWYLPHFYRPVAIFRIIAHACNAQLPTPILVNIFHALYIIMICISLQSYTHTLCDYTHTVYLDIGCFMECLNEGKNASWISGD